MMETIENIVEIFVKSWKEKNKDAALRALNDIPGYLENLTQKDGGKALQILLNEKQGILQFIHTVLFGMRKHEIENIKVVLKEAFLVLQVLIESFKTYYVPYVEQTREMCFKCIKSTCWFYSRKAASETMKLLIKYYSHLDLQLDNVVEHFSTSYLAVYNRKEGCIFYIIIGTIASQCPTKSEKLRQSIADIYKLLYNDFKYQCTMMKSKPTEEVKIYLDCYVDMLTNFKPFAEDHTKGANYLKNLFSHLSDIIFSHNAAHTVKNKTKYLISTHMHLFSDFIFAAYKEWHSILNRFLVESEINTHIGVLRNYYSNMVLCIVKHDDQEAFLYFKTYFASNLSNKNLFSQQRRLLVYGLGEFSHLFKKYAKTEMHDIFQAIAKQALPFYTKEKETDSDYECVAEYLNALAQIIRHMPDVSKYHISIIVELSAYFVKRYAETKVKNKLYAIKALKSTFHHISHLEKHYQSEYFNSFIREGIVQSCSQTLLIDVEIQKEIENLAEKPISYKNYLPLWNDLFQMDSLEYSQFLNLQIFNELVNVIVSFINKLNLNVTSCEEDLTSCSSFSLKADNESDFLFFINIVDLYYDIFDEIDSCLLQPSAEKLLKYFVKCSYKHQMISGFYKLIEAIFKKSDIFTDSEVVLSKSSSELILRYLSNTLKLVYAFSDELQLSCIHMIFNAPTFFIKDLIVDMAPIFEIAFSMGLTDLSIAFCALNSLEQWIKSAGQECPADLAKKIVHYLEPYLTSEESLADAFQGVQRRRRGARRRGSSANGRAEAGAGPEGEDSLEDFQNKVLLFYGSLDSDALLDYIDEKSNDTKASWSRKADLQCELRLPELCLKVELDSLLPRVIELTKSGDLGVKMSACESLHAIITVALGSRLAERCFDGDLCAALLRLGCDRDEAVRALYRPFVLQLTHYFGSKLARESRAARRFVDRLFDALGERLHTPTRDFCGLCLREFVEWSARQSTDAEPTNVRAIVRRITGLALLPSREKRSAAAVAFNHIQPVLRDNVGVVSVYWLEFLHAFVKSMDSEDEDEDEDENENENEAQTSEALGHVARVMRAKRSVFVARSPDRRQPPGFPDESLKGALLWLFRQCGSSSKASCRRRCMEIFEELLPCLARSDVPGVVGVAEVNQVVAANLASAGAKAYLKCLHFYSWIIEKQLLPVEHARALLQGFDDERAIVNEATRHVVSAITGTSPRPSGTLGSLINQLTLEIFNFLLAILKENEGRAEHVPWNESLLVLIVRCLIEPQSIAMSAKNLRGFEKLPVKLESLLKSMKNCMNKSESRFRQFEEIFLSHTAAPLYLQYDDIAKVIDDEQQIDILKQFVDGLLILKKCGIFGSVAKSQIDAECLKNKLDDVFQALHAVVMNCNTCRQLDDRVLEYLSRLVEFFLEGNGTDAIAVLVQFVMIDTPLTASNGNEVAHGEYFVEKFKEPVLGFLLKEPAESLKVLDQVLKKRINTVRVFDLVGELLTFAQSQRGSAESESLADEVIARFSLFSQYLNELESRKTLFFNINKKAVQLKKDPTTALASNHGTINEFKSWIYAELTSSENADLGKKTLILQNFGACLAYNKDNKDSSHEFLYISFFLRDRDSELYAAKLEADELLTFQSSHCLKTLLQLLVLTKSVTIYEACMQFSAGIYEVLIKDDPTEHLAPYLNSIGDEKALQSVKVAHKQFMKLTRIQERLDVLKKFLIPSMELCRSAVIEKLFAERAKDMLECVRTDMDKLAGCEPADRKHLIVSQMGCYNMFEVMFAKHEIKQSEDFADPLRPGETKRLNQLLMLQILDLRSFEAKSDDEKEITRLLHCAAVNCSVSIASLKDEERFYKYIFIMDQKKKQLIWERIVDCDRKYDLSEAASKSVRKDRKKLINIRRSLKQQKQQHQESSFIRGYDLSMMSLTLAENVHAYDLNDAIVLGQERRLDLSFESDQLNEHECMPMLVGVILHLYNSEIVSLPESEGGRRELPSFLTCFRDGFVTQQDNARLFLLKIVCNAKLVFLRYMREFFVPVCEAAYMYLGREALNYVIRDILVLLVESGFEPASEDEGKVAHRLVRNLMPRLASSSGPLYRYNLEIFEGVCRLYGRRLACPENLEALARAEPELAIEAIAILLRSGLEPAVEAELLSRARSAGLLEASLADCSPGTSLAALGARFEAMGRQLGNLEAEAAAAEEAKLGALLGALRGSSPGLCVRCLLALYRGCCAAGLLAEERCSRLVRLARPSQHEEHELLPLCLELFLLRMPGIEALGAEALATELLGLGLRRLLAERRLAGCELLGLRILGRLVGLLPEPELRAYLEPVASGLVGPRDCLLEQRLLGHGLLAEAYARHPPPSELGRLCGRALVRALLDPAEPVQRLALGFWAERGRLPAGCAERLLAGLELYEPGLHDACARLLCVLVLGLAGESSEDKRPMFGRPLADCEFREYELAPRPTRRRSHWASSMAPLFAPSLASQLGQLGLPAGPGFAAAPPASKLPDPSQNQLSRRLVAQATRDPGASSSYRQQRQLHSSAARGELHRSLRTEAEARRNSAKIYRTYRIGDLPDIEITQAAFVESLRQLIMRDWLACRSLAVNLVCALVERLRDSEGHASLLAGLEAVFERVLRDSSASAGNDFAPLVLEVGLRVRGIALDPGLVGSTCAAMGLSALGVLLLEEGLQRPGEERAGGGSPPSKRSKLASELAAPKESLLQLARLYKSIGLTDLVASVLGQPGVFSEELRDATFAQLGGYWSRARLAYEAAYKAACLTGEPASEREHCLHGEFECLAQLANWDKITAKLDYVLNKEYDTVWNDPSKRRLVPWIFEAQLQAALLSFLSAEEPANQAFLAHFGTWISEREMDVKRTYGEQMAMFLLCGSASEERARHALECCLDQVREDWIRSSSLSKSRRSNMSLKLRAILNIDLYVKALQYLDSAKLEEHMGNLLKYWDQHLPNPTTNDLLSWNKLVTYRLSFLRLLHEKLEIIDDNTAVLNDLILSGIKQRMRISELAISVKNPSVVKKHLSKIDPALVQLHLEETELCHRYELNASKYKLISSEAANNEKKKFDYYLSSWEVAEELSARRSVNDTVKIDINYHLSDLVSSLLKDIENHEGLLQLVSNNAFICETIKKYNNSSTIEALNEYRFKKLEESCLLGSEKERGDNYAKFGRFCYDLNQRCKIHDPELDKHLVSSILQGMILGSSEAARYFPCLLKSELYNGNEEIKTIFSCKVKQVQSWMFLSCKDQIISYLNDHSFKELLLPMIERIFDDYPNAIAYDLNQLIKCIGPNVNLHIYRKLENVFVNKGIKEFLEGLHHMCQPELYLQHQLLDLIVKEDLAGRAQKNVDALLTDLYGDSAERAKNKQPGAIYRIALSSYKEEIEKLRNMDIQSAQEHVQMMCANLKLDMKKRLENAGRGQTALQIKDYSPYLAYFSGCNDQDIEVPGQYDGSRKPMTQYHVKVAKFDRFVSVMQSKCSPIKINIIGNDAKSYSYLVKCGEDLRQDQRLQQIFKTTNDALTVDLNCRQRHLSINTYHVLPLSINLGLIQWIDKTKTLKEFIEFSMKDKGVLRELSVEYEDWIRKAGKSSQVDKCYKEALKKYSTSEVVKKMTKLISRLECDLLKKTFATLSPSLECFVSLRHNFITSYATMSVIHWLTGVGDRHLENLLIEVKSGKCLAIDFGLAFGTGVDQSVPELVPFRLTPQILGLLRPFNETALFGITMTHALGAVRKEHGPLFAQLDVFIHEPLNWTQNVNKYIEEEIERQASNWIPQKKIDIVKKKLNGSNPSTITLEELSSVHFQYNEADPFYLKYKAIITGADYPTSMRLKLCKDTLTPEEQVQCLLDQAKDLNLLGRMWVGWSPFV